MRRLCGIFLLLTGAAQAQRPCSEAVVYSPCDIVVEGPAPAELYAEFRSPEYKTYRLPAFDDGPNRRVFRITPVLAGEWIYRSGDKVDKFTAAPAPDATAFIKRANVHHWQYTEARKPHLYVGADYLPGADPKDYAAKKFTHLAVPVSLKDGFPAPEQPNPAYFQTLDKTISSIHAAGLTTDLILAASPDEWNQRFPTPRARSAAARYLVGRYAAFNIVWVLAAEWESSANPRTTLKELGLAVKSLDPYDHPRTSRAVNSSAALGPDGWLDFVTYGPAASLGEAALISVEHQLNTVPQLALIDGSLPPDDFRKRLWNASMSGAYPMLKGPAAPDSPNAQTLAAWASFFLERTRFWDIEPYFDLDGGRSLAAPGIRNDDYDIGSVEHIVYVEHPQKVSMTMQRHSYDVYWLNPSTGVATKDKKDWKGDYYEGTPPDAARDWVLHLSRDGRKEGMLNSYKFESWPIPVQEPERSAQKAPFELTEPKPDATLTAGQSVKFTIKLKRQTGGTRRMTYVLFGENVRDLQGNRVLATGPEGTFTIPPGILTAGPGVLNFRIAALNAPGKVYLIDTVFNLRPKQ